MQAPDLQILCTRSVDKMLVDKAKRKGFHVDILSFIETAPLLDIEVQQEIEWASTEEAVVAFTSMNAVEAVVSMLDGFVPEWRIYCLGARTQQLVIEYFGDHSVAGTADNAGELADEIIENEEPDELIFFCGNRRREELPEKLRAADIEVTEIIVYETTTIEHRLEKKYDGVLFFSPSAVESFFTNNGLPENSTVFAIGETTAATVRKFCPNKIIISSGPDKNVLFEEMMNYFK